MLWMSMKIGFFGKKGLEALKEHLKNFKFPSGGRALPIGDVLAVAEWEVTDGAAPCGGAAKIVYHTSTPQATGSHSCKKSQPSMSCISAILSSMAKR
ncbi:hypothetical protein NL676_021693 [Syzygium grande]|nr:hypothetical protein NL676_021693 [Syzygium grande]